MNILGLGTGIIECLRIGKMIERHGELFINRVYTMNEIRFCQTRRHATQEFAGRWAAKEAVLQLLGARPKPGLSYRDIELRNDSLGKPTVRLRGGLRDLVVSQGIQEILVAIAHSRMHAVAHAIALGGTGKSMLDDEG
ncbi:MAG TPA: holo-ACP synthase [Pirellulales bacterium]